MVSHLAAAAAGEPSAGSVSCIDMPLLVAEPNAFRPAVSGTARVKHTTSAYLDCC